MIHFKPHVPNFCDYETIEKDFDTLQDLLDYLHWAFEPKKTGTKYTFSCGDKETIMVSAINQHFWYVLGTVDGIDLTRYFPNYEEVSLPCDNNCNKAFIVEKIIIERIGHLEKIEKNNIPFEDYDFLMGRKKGLTESFDLLKQYFGEIK